MVNIMDKKSIDEFFESLSDEELKEKFDKYERPENMSKYRFKTKEEFIRDGLWDEEFQTPSEWNDEGEMNHYMGKYVPSEFNRKCDESSYIRVDGWEFSPHDYMLKEGLFNYTGDKVMEVSDCGEFWRIRVVFGTKNGVYLAWSSADSLEQANEVSAVVEWRFAREVI